MNNWIVITTINRPTKAIEKISDMCGKGWSAVVVGDTKTPSDWSQKGIHFLSVEGQKDMFGPFADQIPYRHYCRKNLGYLYAMKNGADLILETDDDNIPYPTFGQSVNPEVNGRLIRRNGWVNIYKNFTDAHVWPRGLPLDEIHSHQEHVGNAKKHCPIQQYLADRDPDVDAIFRLVNKGDTFFNRQAEPVILEPGTWCPFNSQNTLFLKEAFPMLYLPCHVSFRMTDIWRSFVAQAALWIKGSSLAFHTSTVEQVRNEHDLMVDFEQEVIGYRENRRIGSLLSKKSEELVGKNLRTPEILRELWISLHDGGIVPEVEMKIIEKWVQWFE